MGAITRLQRSHSVHESSVIHGEMVDIVIIIVSDKHGVNEARPIIFRLPIARI